jgi:hypothetical protein
MNEITLTLTPAEARLVRIALNGLLARTRDLACEQHGTPFSDATDRLDSILARIA